MKKNILIYNPFSKTGHLDSWLLHIFKAYENSFEIDVFSPDHEILRKSGVKFCALSMNKARMLNPLGMYLLFWDSVNFVLGLKEKNWNEISIKRRPGFLRYVLKIVMWASAKILPIAFLKNEIYPTKIFAENVYRATRLKNYDYVFITYMDFLAHSRLFWKLFDSQVDVKISGIKFDTDNVQDQGILKSKNLKGIFYLDLRVVNFMNQKNNPSYLLPDISFNEVPSSSEQSDKILELAKKRTIVFLGGAIGRQKNIGLWLNLIQKSDPSTYFFLQAGKINQSTISKDELALLKVMEKRENFFVLDRYFEEELDFNLLISISDVIFAAYKNFNLSSNLVTKAIFLKKPILVSSNTLMSTIVEKYNLGISIEQDSVEQALEALDKLRVHNLSDDQYKIIQKDFSVEKFRNSLLSVLS